MKKRNKLLIVSLVSSLVLVVGYLHQEKKTWAAKIFGRYFDMPLDSIGGLTGENLNSWMGYDNYIRFEFRGDVKLKNASEYKQANDSIREETISYFKKIFPSDTRLEKQENIRVLVHSYGGDLKRDVLMLVEDSDVYYFRNHYAH